MSPKISNSTVTLEDSYFLITLQNPKETAMLNYNRNGMGFPSFVNTVQNPKGSEPKK